MNNLTEKLVALLLSCFLLMYTGYQVFRYFDTPYSTQVAMDFTVADTAKVTGVIIRDEMVIKDKVDGVVSYLYEDGTKVTEYNDIAEIYPNENNVRLQKQIRGLDSDINMLKEASDKTSIAYINAESLSRQISQAVSKVVNTGASGMVGDLPEEVQDLTLLLNRNQIVTGKAQDYDQRIQSLTAQRDSLTAQLSGSFTTFRSPTAGYFVRNVDGLEDTLTPDNMKELSVADIEGFAAQKVESSKDYIGKIIRDQNWYYAAIVPLDQLKKFKVGDTVSLNFNLLNLNDIPFSVEGIKTDDTSKNAVVFLKNNYVLPELVEVRNPSADVVFKSYSGLKVPVSAKRYEGQTVGVYVLENDIIRFKTINIVYENEEYILCGANTDETRPLKLFDRVIVEGNDLRDGKSAK